jgi:hypothetical protein
MSDNDERVGCIFSSIVLLVVLGAIGYGVRGYVFKTDEVPIDAFIVTKSRENIKLGLLEIQCAKLNDVVAEAKHPVLRLKKEKTYVRSRLLEKTKDLEKLTAELAQSKQLEDESKAVDRRLGELIGDVQRLEFERTEKERKVAEESDSFFPPKVSAKTDILAASQERLARARQALSECTASLRELRGRLEDLQRRRALLQPLEKEVREIAMSLSDLENQFVRAAFAAFPVPAFIVKTDADGKAMVRVSRDQPFIIWASGNRELPGGQLERYDWLVRVPAAGNTEQKLFLSSDNLATEDSILALLDLNTSAERAVALPPTRAR